ncbi:NAD(P)-binding protein [Sphingomonas sp. C8-2]|jgi:5-(hydroxymethyl)furfural/furfural oxidase|nr:NAD(P)-binding protein [Sphingomonas sp. C8-2]
MRPDAVLPARADVIIVGGGTAGCVLASRLSEDPRVSVLLVEAGRDHLPGHEPDDIMDSFPRAATPGHLWPGLTAERRPGQPPRPFEQARVVGGGSSVMGMLAMRGLPADYDGWAAAGAEGWGWADVLPYFRRLERDLDFGGPAHGREGPLPVRRHPPESWPPFCRAVTAAAARQGLPLAGDLNDDASDGIYPVPMNNSARHRVSAATAYLDAAVRTRPNLIIAARCSVTAIRLRERRAVGVDVVRDGAARAVEAGEVILSAGAIHSPALLLRSGIGPGLAIDRPGVGADLQNHPLLPLSVVLRRDAVQPPDVRPAFQNCLRYSSGHPGTPAADMFVTILNKTGLHPLGRRIGGLMLAVYGSFSRGSVSLDPATGTPRIGFDLLGDERDEARLAGAVRFAAALLADEEVRRTADQPFFPINGALVQRLSRPEPASRIVNRLATAMLDAPALLRGWAVGVAGPPLRTLLDDEERLHRFVRENAVPTGHVCGTCRMGSDEAAVVDGRLRVRGVEGLRVVDASVMPAIVRANTNIPVVMIAEKAADIIKGERT